MASPYDRCNSKPKHRRGLQSGAMAAPSRQQQSIESYHDHTYNICDLQYACLNRIDGHPSSQDNSDKVEDKHDGQGLTVTVIHHAHRRSIADANGMDLSWSSWQTFTKSVAVFERIVKLTSPTSRQGHRCLGGAGSAGSVETVEDGHEDQRGTQMATIPKEEGTNEAEASTMGWREAGGAVEEAYSLDRASSEMTGAKSVKIARDGIVIVGSGTAIILIFLVGRALDEGVFGCE